MSLHRRLNGRLDLRAPFGDADVDLLHDLAVGAVRREFKPATSGLVGGTSSETISTIFALPSVVTVAQFASMVPISPKPIVSELETKGFCLSDGS
jgi:hypothetical protein